MRYVINDMKIPLPIEAYTLVKCCWLFLSLCMLKDVAYKSDSVNKLSSNIFIFLKEFRLNIIEKLVYTC